MQQLRELQGITYNVLVLDDEDIQAEWKLSEKTRGLTQTQQATITQLGKQFSVSSDSSLSLANLPAAILSTKELIPDCFAPAKLKAVTAKPDRISEVFSI